MSALSPDRVRTLWPPGADLGSTLSAQAPDSAQLKRFGKTQGSVFLRRMRFFRFSSLLLAFGLATTAVAQVTVTYEFPAAQPQGYEDAGLKLTDGVANVTAWGGSEPVDVTPFVGWDSAPATVLFSFSGLVEIHSVTVWLADSDGDAGVFLPESVKFWTDDEGLAEVHEIENPDGSGTTVGFTYSLSGFVTDELWLQASHTDPGEHQWIMMSEVELNYTAVPEPSTYAALFGAVALGAGLVRRRFNKAVRK